jgi:hypothetical protein
MQSSGITPEEKRLGREGVDQGRRVGAVVVSRNGDLGGYLPSDGGEMLDNGIGASGVQSYTRSKQDRNPEADLCCRKKCKELLLTRSVEAEFQGSTATLVASRLPD